MKKITYFLLKAALSIVLFSIGMTLVSSKDTMFNIIGVVVALAAVVIIIWAISKVFGFDLQDWDKEEVIESKEESKTSK